MQRRDNSSARSNITIWRSWRSIRFVGTFCLNVTTPASASTHSASYRIVHRSSQMCAWKICYEAAVWSLERHTRRGRIFSWPQRCRDGMSEALVILTSSEFKGDSNGSKVVIISGLDGRLVQEIVRARRKICCRSP
jgi:hypothetical protein